MVPDRTFALYLPRQTAFNIIVVLLCLMKGTEQLTGNTKPASEYPASHQGHNPPFGSSNYKDLSKSKHFIDKSLFIEAVLRNRYGVELLTAPRSFGKSVNLDMLREFLEIKVNENGKETTNKSQTIELFKNLHIFNDKDIVKKYMGQHPVIYIDFKCNDSIQSVDDVMDVLNAAVIRTYAKHGYLLQSTKLDDNEKALFKLRCGFQRKNQMKNELRQSLKDLSAVLQKHFNKEPILLIDDYDSVIIQTVIKKSINTEEVISLIIDIIWSVDSALITGTLDIPNRERRPYRFKHYSYLDDHECVKHYGATEKEVRDLLLKHGLGKHMVLEAGKWYGGYCKPVTNTFCIGPLLQFLQHGTVESDWPPSGSLVNMARCFRLSDIKNEIDKLILGMNIHVGVGSSEPFRITDFKKAIFKRSIHYYDNVFWELLLRMGYLTFSNNATKLDEYCYNKVDLRVPNKYIELQFVWSLTKYYVSICHFNIDTSVNALNKVSGSANEEIFHTFVKSFKNVIALFKKKELHLNINELAFHALLYCITCRSIFKSEIYLNKGINQVSVFMTKGNLGMVIELKYDFSVEEDFNNTVLIHNEHLISDHTLWETKLTDSIFMRLYIDRELDVTASYKINDGKIVEL